MLLSGVPSNLWRSAASFAFGHLGGEKEKPPEGGFEVVFGGLFTCRRPAR